uniref:Uncharacterized protein n=1 Tax=mine drainage metagenome TaxID=410659 RepID=E6Q0F8_9ZZZZ
MNRICWYDRRRKRQRSPKAAHRVPRRKLSRMSGVHRLHRACIPNHCNPLKNSIRAWQPATRPAGNNHGTPQASESQFLRNQSFDKTAGDNTITSIGFKCSLQNTRTFP